MTNDTDPRIRGTYPVENGRKPGEHICGWCAASVEFPWAFCGRCGNRIDWGTRRRPPMAIPDLTEEIPF